MRGGIRADNVGAAGVGAAVNVDVGEVAAGEDLDGVSGRVEEMEEEGGMKIYFFVVLAHVGCLCADGEWWMARCTVSLWRRCWLLATDVCMVSSRAGGARILMRRANRAYIYFLGQKCKVKDIS